MAVHNKTYNVTRKLENTYKKLFFLLCSALIIFPYHASSSEKNTPSNPMNMGLADLLDVEVTSVSKRKENASEVPAALFVITAEDIRRSGVNNIPELLRMVPGLQVARGASSQWAISARGFNDQYANKLLVLIDGRSVFNPTFSGVFWDSVQQMLDNIERIEVIRGPGATLWGTEAVNGVINIITKNAKLTDGLRIEGVYGQREAGATIRHGKEIFENVWYRVHRSYNYNRSNITDGAKDDDWAASNTGFRVDWEPSKKDNITVIGDYYNLDERFDREFPSLSASLTETGPGDTKAIGGNISFNWEKEVSQESITTFKTYYSREKRKNEGFSTHINSTFDMEFQHQWEPNKHNQIVWGAGYRLDYDDLRGSFFVDFEPDSTSKQKLNAFVQDRIPLVRDELYLTMGAKLEYNEYTHLEFQPSGRLTWLPYDNHTFWSAISRAKRSPSRGSRGFRLISSAENSSTFTQLQGQEDLEAESMTAYEIGYRAKPSDNFAFDVTAFYNEYDELITFEAGTPVAGSSPQFPSFILVPLEFDNRDRAEAYGAEISANWHPLNEWRIAASYSFLKNDFRGIGTGIASEDSSPEHQFNIRSYIDLPYDLEFDSFLYYNDNLSGEDIDSYIRLDLRIGWHPLDFLELSISGQNLTDSSHPEFSPFTYTKQTEVGRTVYGKVIFKF